MPNFHSTNRNKRGEVTNQAIERTNCPISAVPKTEMKKTQGNSEENQKTAETERSNTLQSKEGKTDDPSSSGNTPSPSPRKRLKRPTFTSSKLEQAQGKKNSMTFKL